MARNKQFHSTISPFEITTELKERLYKHVENTQVPQAAVIRNAIEMYLDKVSPEH
jgi:predicted DNA-binding protein